MTKSNSYSVMQIHSHPIHFSTRTQKDRWHLLASFLALLGYSGTVLSAMSLYQPQCSKPIVMLTAVLAFLCAGIVHFFKRYASKISAVCVLLTLGVLLLAGSRTAVGIQYLVNQYYRIAHHTDVAYFEVETEADPVFCVTLFLCCMLVLLAFFFVHFTVKRPLFLLPVAAAFLLIEPGLYMGIALRALAAAPLLAYACGMLALRLTLQQSNSAFGKNTAAVCGTYTAFLVLIVYGITAILGVCSGYTRSDKARLRRQNFSHALGSIELQSLGSFNVFPSPFGADRNTEQSDLGTKSQLRFQDDLELTVTFDQLPDSTLYFKGFTGCTYTDNSWLSSVDETVFADTQQITDLISTFQCAPQNFPFLFQRSISPNYALIECTITPKKRTSRSYQPYTAFSTDAVFQSDAMWNLETTGSYSWTISDAYCQTLSTLNAAPLSDSLYTLPNSDDSTVQEFLGALDTDGTDVYLSSRFPMYQAADQPEEIAGKVIPAALFESCLYRDYVKEAYTALPEDNSLDAVYEILPDALKQEASPQTPEEQFQVLYDLRTWIAERTEYSTAPGKTPGTRDFVSFFLLENQKGYCMHYAAAGTILARYLGIPARYCEGYIAGEDVLDAAEQIDDNYCIELTDRQSHAWCEFYIDGYGWVPFEMTPGYYKTNSTPESLTEPEPEPDTETENNAISTQSSTQNHTKSTVYTTAPSISNAETPQHSGGNSIPGWIKASCIIAVLIILCGVLYHLMRIRHIQRRRRMLQDTAHPRRAIYAAYRYLLRLLQFCGIPYQGQFLLDYRDIAVRELTKQHLPSDATIQIISLTLAVDMGNKLPEPAEQQEITEALLQFAGEVYSAQNPVKRFYMKLLHLF